MKVVVVVSEVVIDDRDDDTGHESQSSPSRLPILAPAATGRAGQVGEDKPFQTAFMNPAVGPRCQDVLLSRLLTKADVSPVPGLWREG